ncbi:hypothetical protein SFRURICE_000242, partial [Spodoptera frugiperda]
IEYRVLSINIEGISPAIRYKKIVTYSAPAQLFSEGLVRVCFTCNEIPTRARSILWLVGIRASNQSAVRALVSISLNVKLTFTEGTNHRGIGTTLFRNSDDHLQVYWPSESFSKSISVFLVCYLQIGYLSFIMNEEQNPNSASKCLHNRSHKTYEFHKLHTQINRTKKIYPMNVDWNVDGPLFLPIFSD